LERGRDTVTRRLSIALLLLCTAAAFAQAPEKQIIRSNVAVSGLVGQFYRPAAAPGCLLPGLIVLGGSEGGLNPAVSREAMATAGHGFAALQLGYFGWRGLPETMQLIPVEYFERAVTWLRAQPGVDPGHIGILGTSIGGEAALLVAAHDPAITAVVAAVPSGVVWEGLSGGIDRRPASSFSLAGNPLPDLPYGWTGALRDVYGRYAGGLAGLTRHSKAIIPVERINGPVMLICGSRDSIWPSCRMAAAVVARLRAKRFQHAVAFLKYPHAGHAVFGPPIDPSSPDYADLGSLGGSAAANGAARQTAWPDSLAFLDKALKPVPIPTAVGFTRRVIEQRSN
jgi:dienelactone hydrolase